MWIYIYIYFIFLYKQLIILKKYFYNNKLFLKKMGYKRIKKHGGKYKGMGKA